ncbi:hypothetical protein AGMMS49982_10830 [Bacteroidia bacterium]|nr:hypothetical protein AGMMS49982_10830 [Bacteroidia bacterium]
MKIYVLTFLRTVLGERRYYNFLEIFCNKYLAKIKLNKYYQNNQPRALNQEKYIICMVDGKMHHGGLSDRLRGFVSIYAYCKKHNYQFKIFFRYPFRLEDYLVPNTYNWQISEADISYNSIDSKAVVLLSADRENEQIIQEKLAEKLLKQDYKQIHIYTNTDYAGANFTLLFHELFKPSVELQKQIDNILALINAKYIAIAFRFQSLLGDFKDEANLPSLTGKDRELLIAECLEAIKQIDRTDTNHSKIVVTSDSKTFINRAQTIDNVFIIPGNIIHIDYNTNDNGNMKTFWDLYVLSFAEKIYQVKNNTMFKSGFAKRAASINAVPYEEYLF